MIIRFPVCPPREDRFETHSSGVNRTGPRRLSRREIEHRERMLQHLARVAGLAQANPWNRRNFREPL
jgi:hypothetical protein